MSESLAIRKQQLVSECREQYAPQPVKWWQRSPDNTYQFTWDIYVSKNYPRVFADEIVIRNNKEEALGAFCVVLGFGIFTSIIIDNTISLLIYLLIIGVIVFIAVLFLIKAKDRSPKIILNREGLWTKYWQYTIPWKEMLVTCIRTDSSGEGSSYFLRVHYYDPAADEFKTAEYNLGGLEKETDTIACFIHQFRLQYGKAKPGE